MPVIRYAMLCLLFYVNVNLYTFYVTVMLYTFMLCYVMLCYAYVMLYILYVPVMLCMLYVTFCSALFCVVHILCACYVICYVMLPYVHFMWLLCYTCYVLCYVTFYVMLCYYMLCACYVIHMLFYVILCCIMLCYTHVPVTHRNWHLAMRGIGIQREFGLKMPQSPPRAGPALGQLSSPDSNRAYLHFCTGSCQSRIVQWEQNCSLEELRAGSQSGESRASSPGASCAIGHE